MSEPQRPGGIPLVLIINDEEWTTRSIQSILSRDGYSVLTAYTGRQGIDLASRVRPDIVLVDLHLPDINGIELCSQLRSLPAMRSGVPILIMTSGTLSREERLEAYHKGAWSVLCPPFDPQELVARLEPYLLAKRDLDQALTGTDVDPGTGCYNAQGLLRRLEEMSADARRNQRPLACVVIGPSTIDADGEETPPSGALANQFVERVGDVLRKLKRTSDTVGRTGQADFVILAPGTDQGGAEQLVARVLECMNGVGQQAGLGAGIYAVSGVDPNLPAPEEFLRRATGSLRSSQTKAPFAANRLPTPGSV